MKQPTPIRYVIGIDTGTNTGFAIWDRKDKVFLQVCSLKIHEAIQSITMLEREYLDQCIVRVEDARLRKWIPKEKNIKQRVGRAKGAGSVSRDASIWEDFLLSIKVNFELVSPSANLTKLSAERFEKFTGYKHKTNEHARDAAMLCFNW